MRLLNVHTKSLEDFSDENPPPPYAILSHTWGADGDEVSFGDIEEAKYEERATWRTKLMGCCKQADRDGYLYVWVDTCCIDKRNNVELQEALISMFRWYREAAVCYAFLKDVPKGDTKPRESSIFIRSHWFERGWTLQETLAPESLKFFNAGWEFLGTKAGLATLVETITNIPRVYLVSPEELHSASVAQRMSWAARRKTKRPEDRAYCLLGIFGVSMEMRYGDGGEMAFRRLQQEIMNKGGDDSILAWGRQPPVVTPPDRPAEMVSGGVFATSPSDFLFCHDIKSSELSASASPRPSYRPGFLKLQVTMVTNSKGESFGLLGCHSQITSDMVVGIPLAARPTRKTTDEYIRPRGRHSQLFPKSSFDALSTKSIEIQIDEDRPINSVAMTRCLIDRVTEQVDIIEVEPASCWKKEKFLIQMNNDLMVAFARFRPKEQSSDDFILALHSETSEPRIQGSLMIASHGTTLREIAQKFSLISDQVLGSQCANIGAIGLRVNVEASAPNFKTVKILESTESSGLPTVNDATAALQNVERKRLEELEERITEMAKERDALEYSVQQRAQLREEMATEYDILYDPGDSDDLFNLASSSDSDSLEDSETLNNCPEQFRREHSAVIVASYDSEDFNESTSLTLASDSHVSDASDTLSDISEQVRHGTVSSGIETRQSRYLFRKRGVPEPAIDEINCPADDARQSTSTVKKRRQSQHKREGPRPTRHSNFRINKILEAAQERDRALTAKQIELLEENILLLPDESKGRHRQLLTMCRGCGRQVLDRSPLYTRNGSYIQRRRTCSNRECDRYYQYQNFMVPIDKSLKSVRQQDAAGKGYAQLRRNFG